MLISEPRFAGAYRAGKETAVFDDIGCLLDALDEEKLETAGGGGSEPAPGDRHAEIWFLDQEQRWMTVAEARFVRSDALGTPMGGGIQAFADRATAEETATRSGGSIVDDLAELRALRRAAVVRGGS
jgi:hypothetical protein